MTEIEMLKSLRSILGYSQRDVAAIVGIPPSTVREFENGKRRSLGKLQSWMQSMRYHLKEDRKFRVGGIYQISKAGPLSSMATTWPDYEFEYVGKQGIHHVFRQVTGGWSRTYTDAQLIGKKILEVRA